jgi:hypothetical protein
VDRSEEGEEQARATGEQREMTEEGGKEESSFLLASSEVSWNRI